MFFVVTLNRPKTEWEYIGAFSKKDEANAFALENKTADFAPIVHEGTFAEIIDHATTARLGAMASVFDRMVKCTVESAKVGDSEIKVTCFCDTSDLLNFINREGKAIAEEVSAQFLKNPSLRRCL